MKLFMRGPHWPLRLFVVLSASLLLGCSPDSSSSSSSSGSEPIKEDPQEITQQELQKLNKDLPSKYELSPEEKELISDEIPVSEEKLLGQLLNKEESDDEGGSL